MPPKRSITLTQAELRLMKILWERGESAVSDMVTATAAETELAYNSVLTTVRVLEDKGYVKHVKDGRAHVYMPLVGRKEATRFEIRHLVNRFFKSSEEALVLNILEDSEIDSDELTRLRQLLQEHK